MPKSNEPSPEDLELLVRKLHEEVVKNGFPSEVCDAAADLVKKVVERIPAKQESVEVSSAYQNFVDILRRVAGDSEWVKPFVRNVIIKILIEIFSHLFN